MLRTGPEGGGPRAWDNLQVDRDAGTGPRIVVSQLRGWKRKSRQRNGVPTSLSGVQRQGVGHVSITCRTVQGWVTSLEMDSLPPALC